MYSLFKARGVTQRSTPGRMPGPLLEMKLAVPMQGNQMYCEFCKILFGTHWNFKRHQKQQHTDKNTPEMIAERLEQNQRRNLSRRERYATEPLYKKKSLSENSRLRRAPFDRDDESSLRAEGSEDVGDRKKSVKRENVLDTYPGAVGKVGGTGGKPLKNMDMKSGVFQVETKPLTDIDILSFFKPRSCVPGCL